MTEDEPTTRQGRRQRFSSGAPLAKLESTSVPLKRLDNKNLALEPTQKVPLMKGTEKASGNNKPQGRADKRVDSEQEVRHPALRGERRKSGGGGGFDPNNSR